MELEAHLARLAASAGALRPSRLSGDVADRARRAAAQANGPCRLRIVALADGGVAVALAPLPVRGPLRLEPVTVPAGWAPTSGWTAGSWTA